MSCYTLAIIFISLIPCGRSQTKPDNFGPYTMEWTSYETCKGPKQKNCGTFEMQNKQNMSDIVFVIDFPKECPVNMVRVTIGSKHNKNVTKKLWNYSLDNPCQHFVMGPILIESFNLTSNCKIDKGNYEVHLNMLEKSTKFLGNNFFYGIYDFKVTAYNKFSNFFCVHSVIDISKPRNKV